MLAAILLPFHRPAELHRRGRDHRLLRIERRLRAEAAADQRGDDADRFQIALEQVRQGAAAQMRRLRRRPDIEHVGRGVVARQHRTAFERHRRAAMHVELDLEHMRRIPECAVDVAISHRHKGRDVGLEIGVHARRAGLHRVARVAHRRQRLVVDLDGRSRVFRSITALCHDHRDGLADVADLVAGERNLRAWRPDRRVRHQHRDHAGGDARRHVVGGQHGVHAGHAARGLRVDLADARMRVRASHKGCVQHALEIDVVDEAALSGQQCRVLEAGDPCAEVLCAHCCLSPPVPVPPASAFTRVFDAIWRRARQYRSVGAQGKERRPQFGPDKNMKLNGKRCERGQKGAPLVNPAAAAIWPANGMGINEFFQ